MTVFMALQTFTAFWYLQVTCMCTLYIPALAYTDKKPCKLEKKTAATYFTTTSAIWPFCEAPGPPRRPFLTTTAFIDNWRPFLTIDGLFWCLRHILDVHGSLHGLYWRPTAFFDGQRPFFDGPRAPGAFLAAAWPDFCLGDLFWYYELYVSTL